MTEIQSQSTLPSFRLTELTINSGHKFCYSLDTTMNPRLTVNIVVLDAVEKSRQTPKRVSFDGV